VLSHITNLPQNLTRQAEQANLKDKIKDQKSNEFKKHLSEVLNEKELMSGKTDNHAGQKPAEPVKHAEIHKEEVKKPVETVKPEIKPKEKLEEVTKPVSADNIELPTSLADVALLKPNVIRAYKHTTLPKLFVKPRLESLCWATVKVIEGIIANTEPYISTVDRNQNVKVALGQHQPTCYPVTNPAPTFNPKLPSLEFLPINSLGRHLSCDTPILIHLNGSHSQLLKSFA
jgi:hypothetical protein